MPYLGKLLELFGEIADEGIYLAEQPKSKGGKNRRAPRLVSIVFTGATKTAHLWRGTTPDAALQLCNAFALLISMAIPELAEVKFDAVEYSKGDFGQVPVFEAKYILRQGSMRRIVTASGGHDRPPEVTDYPL